jgi:hypothetical protein
MIIDVQAIKATNGVKVWLHPYVRDERIVDK